MKSRRIDLYQACGFSLFYRFRSLVFIIVCTNNEKCVYAHTRNGGFNF